MLPTGLQQELTAADEDAAAIANAQEDPAETAEALGEMMISPTRVYNVPEEPREAMNGEEGSYSNSGRGRRIASNLIRG